MSWTWRRSRLLLRAMISLWTNVMSDLDCFSWMFRDMASYLIPTFGFIPFYTCNFFNFFFWLYKSFITYLVYLSITSYSPRMRRLRASGDGLNLLILLFFYFTYCFLRVAESAKNDTRAFNISLFRYEVKLFLFLLFWAIMAV